MNGPESNNKDFSLFLELLENLYNTSKKQLKFNEDVKVNFVKNDQNSLNALGKTASYNPETREVNLYFLGRHPKDLMRSFSHELVHHAQNCRGDFNNISNTNEGYAQTDEHLREMEREAYESGNMIFRDWEDEMKSKGVVPLFSGAPFATIQMGYNENLGDNKMSKNKLKESKLRDLIRGVIQEMFDEDINEESDLDQMMQDAAGDDQAVALGAGDEDIAVGEGHDYDTKGTPLEDPEDPEDPERYMKGKVGGEVVEEQELSEVSGEKEAWDDWKNEHVDDDHIEQIKHHLRALEDDRDHEEHEAEYDHDKYEDEGYDRREENLNESFLPRDRDIRENARKQTYAKLVEKWCK